MLLFVLKEVESGKRWGAGGNICGNSLIVSTRILSNQDASVCFPEPKADINNVAYPLCAGLPRNADGEKAKVGSDAPGSQHSL